MTRSSRRDEQAKKGPGRPIKYQLPAEPIDASPEEVARVVLQAKPKKVYRFEEEAKAKGLKPNRR